MIKILFQLYFYSISLQMHLQAIHLKHYYQVALKTEIMKSIKLYNMLVSVEFGWLLTVYGRETVSQ